MATLNATAHRWVAELTDFQFVIKYCPGKVNINADALSHIPIENIMAGCTETTTKDLIQCATNASVITFKPDSMWITALTTDVSMLEDYSDQIKQCNFKSIGASEFKEAQKNDATIHRVIKYKHCGRFPSKVGRVDEPQSVRALMHEWNSVWLENGILKRKKEYIISWLYQGNYIKSFFEKSTKKWVTLGVKE